MNMPYLPVEKMQAIRQTLEALSAMGVMASQEPSGDMNFSGCASGYCMAWA